MKFIIVLSLLILGCDMFKTGPSKPGPTVYLEPNTAPPPISESPRPGFITLDRLEDAMIIDLQNIGSDDERQDTRYLIGCDRLNQGEPIGEFEQGLNLAMNRLSNERFTYKVTPISQAGCIYRISLDNYSITKSEWRLIESATILDFESETTRNQQLQFLAQTRKPYIFGIETCAFFECDEVADQGGRIYYDLVDQPNLTQDFLADQGINLQALVDSEDVLYSGFSQSIIALGKTRLIEVMESDNGHCIGTFDSQLGGDDLFSNPFSKELALAGGQLNSNKVFRHDAQEWICSLNNGLFGLYRLNNAEDNAEVEAPTNVVLNIDNSIDPSIRIGDCNKCHFNGGAIPFSDQIAAHLRGNSAFGAQEKRLGDIFFRYDKISAVISDINRRNQEVLDELDIVASKDPLTQVIFKPFREEMNVDQIAAFTFLTTESFIERLSGTNKSSQVFGNLLNGGTVSLATLNANFENLVIEMGLFQDIEL